MAEDTITKIVTDTVKTTADIAVVAPAKAVADIAVVAPAKAVAAKAEKAVTAKPAVKAKRAYTKRKARVATAKVVTAAKKTTARTAKGAQRLNRAAAAATATQIERNTDMTNDFTSLFANFQIPGADRFQSLFGDAGTRGTEFATKGQKAVAELSEFAKSNLEAFAEAGRIAAAGARSIGEDALNSSRQGLELASTNAKSLASATSPTEFLQLQAELARASFDRMVAQSSKMTEQVVKLAGEAIQPISTRASVNAERINELMA